MTEATKERNRKSNLARYYRNREKILARMKSQRDIFILQGLNSHGKARTKRATRGTCVKIIPNAKSIVFAYYGNVCFCCRENIEKLLTIDHINNDGYKTRGSGENRLRGAYLYSFVIANSFPSDLQLACFNCNIGRQNNKGVCPHKGEKAIV